MSPNAKNIGSIIPRCIKIQCSSMFDENFVKPHTRNTNGFKVNKGHTHSPLFFYTGKRKSCPHFTISRCCCCGNSNASSFVFLLLLFFIIIAVAIIIFIPIITIHSSRQQQQQQYNQTAVVVGCRAKMYTFFQAVTEQQQLPRE